MSGQDVETAIIYRLHFIEQYVGYWIEELCIPVYPKFHYLWHHLPAELRRNKGGMGSIDEHGVEACHAKADTLIRRSFFSRPIRECLELTIKTLAGETNRIVAKIATN